MNDLDALMDMDVEEISAALPEKKEQVEQKADPANTHTEQQTVQEVKQVHTQEPTPNNEQRQAHSGAQRYLSPDPNADGGMGKDFYDSGQNSANEASIDPEMNAQLLDEYQAKQIAQRGAKTIAEKAQLRMAKRAGII